MDIGTTSLVEIIGVEAIIHFVHYKIIILNATNATIMVIKLVIVDYQNIPLRQVFPIIKKKNIRRYGRKKNKRKGNIM